jgi:hypothetical protein
MIAQRRYGYVGPDDIRRLPAETAVADILAAADLDRWMTGDQAAAAGEPLTFVVTATGMLRVAPRQSEHVAAARGDDVLAAGEMSFVRTRDGWSVNAVTNQSTGYCPEPESWEAVADALDRAGIQHPGGYTASVVFRRCTACGERNIVREDDFTCAPCGQALPRHWNFAGDLVRQPRSLIQGDPVAPHREVLEVADFFEDTTAAFDGSG